MKPFIARSSLVTVAAAAVAVAAAARWWSAGMPLPGTTAVESLAGALQAAVSSSLMLQGMLLTWVAPGVMALGWKVLVWVQLALQALLCSSVHVSRQQFVIHEALLRFLEARGVSSSGAASVMLARDQDMTAAQRVQLLTRKMATSGAACMLRCVAMVTPRGMPTLVTTPQGRVVVIVLGPGEGDPDGVGSVDLYTLGRGAHADLTQFLQEVTQTYARAAHESPAAVFVPESAGPQGWRWRRTSDLRTRGRHTLVLPDGLMDTLLEDARRFFGGAAEYAARQQPFRRGWLLQGPPGTGKTTVAQVVGSELDLPVCVLDLGSTLLNDTGLMALLGSVPVPAVVLMDDVDTVTGAVTQRRDQLSSKSEKVMAPVRLSLATLLNALDGLAAGEGRLVIMTTNAASRLDPALVRPGRCDLVAELPPATTEVIRRLVTAECPQATTRDVDEFVALTDPDDMSPAAVVQLLAEAGGNLRGLLDRCGSGLEGRRFKSVRRLATSLDEILFPMRDAHSGRASLFDTLWSWGHESWFGAVIAFGVNHERMLLSERCAEAAMDAGHADSLAVSTRLPVVDAPSQDAVAATFLRRFPGEADLAREFAGKIVAWTGPVPSWTRIRHHLDMNKDSAAKAVASMDQWLLCYRRCPAANMYKPAGLARVLYYFGAPTDDRMDTLVQALTLAGCRNGDELVSGDLRAVLDAVPKAVAEAVGPVPAATAADDAMAVWNAEKAASVVDAVRKQFISNGNTARSLFSGPMYRPSVARMLMDAYAVDFETAMDAARRVTRPDGRSGFSSRNVCALVASEPTLEACVASMVAVQSRFGFGPVGV
jgi:hypothetical protein